MDDFFSKVDLPGLKDMFIAEHVKNEDFFNLTIEAIVKILKGDMNNVALFLPLYHTEKQNYVESNDVSLKVLNNSSNNDLNMSWSEEMVEVISEVPRDHGYTLASDENVLTVDDECDLDCMSCPDNILEEVESSTHNNIPDDFQFVQNSLYFLLKDSIEGRIILGMYKNAKVLLERRLKMFIIQKVIVENPAKYKITNLRFEEIRSQIAELFPTIIPKDWYDGHRTNVHGQHVSASGCLINFYKRYRKDLALAGITTDSTTPANTSSNSISTELDMLPLIDSNRSKYLIGIVLETWINSFDRRLEQLVLKKNKQIYVQYETYFNTFVYLHSSTGLELLETDCNLIVQRLAATNAIPKTVAENFQTIFSNRWNILAVLICKHGDLSQIQDIKQFRKTHNEYINNVPKPVLALLYAAYFLTKASSVPTKEKGTFTFSRNECVEHFIKIIVNESLVEEYKLKQKRTFTDLGIPVSPYLIFCGTLDNINKAFVVVDYIHYEIKDPLKSVEVCLKICVALHSWTLTCSNVWLYLLEHVYSIRPNTSYAFPPAKSAKTVSGFIKKIDPSFSTLEASDTTT